MPRQPEFKAFLKPEEIFVQAEAFLKASEATNESSVKSVVKGNFNFGLQVSDAATVNHAFACELYLKCLQTIEFNGFYKGHELLTLFNLLSAQSQTEIIKRHDIDVAYGPSVRLLTGSRPKSLLELLTEATNAFVDIRYSFETNKYTPYDLSWVVRTIRGFILELRPDFKELIQTAQSTSPSR